VPGDRELCAALNGTVTLLAPEEPGHLADVDPELIAKAQLARKPLQDILRARESRGEYAWTVGLYPTEGLARRAGMTPEEYARQVETACFLEDGTPVTRWKLLRKQVQEVIRWLNSLQARALRVQSNNVDLLLQVGRHRRWNGITGRNIPSYEIYLSPDWRGTEGNYLANQPSFRQGNRIEDLNLTFRMGQAVSFNASQGHEYAYETLSADAGASRVGEFSLVDRRFSPISRFMANTLYDENHGGEHGSCHIALGQSYANTYDGDPAELHGALRVELGFNESSQHWDLVNTEDKRVTAQLPDGGKVCIYENGEFQY
jgi:aminopeptidase